jgi:hypothetical protein
MIGKVNELLAKGLDKTTDLVVKGVDSAGGTTINVLEHTLDGVFRILTSGVVFTNNLLRVLLNFLFRIKAGLDRLLREDEIPF